MFRKLLIANRGEIACRIMRTARRLGIDTVAVYSEADATSMHVEQADEAWSIGAAPARESYLSIDKIIDVARRTGAEAIHPGYGFLSENPAFAEACAAAGVVFVGPSASAMRLMGSKASAKSLMERAGVSIIPGYHGDATDLASLEREARRLGFPLLVKASSGGGGRGMRLIESLDQLRDAVAAASREALSAFGEGRVLLERRLLRARHVEVQIFADAEGGCLAFQERDCSLQRRRQKILEETPAPGLARELREAMQQAAVTAARSVGYVGAGTVEFLLEDGRFYFLEMNTRLQVEHPITEMVAGQDLVEWQLRVAAGERLPIGQEALHLRGCAIEARICAEDPQQDFLPSTGLIERLRLPDLGEHIRVDAGVRGGDRITPYYDPLLAKLIVWGEHRAAALQRLQRALDQFEIVGPATNLDFLRALSRETWLESGAYDTTSVEANAAELRRTTPLAPEDERVILAAGAAVWLSDLCLEARATAAGRDGACAPWDATDGWRLDGRQGADVEFLMNDQRIKLRLHPEGEGAFRLESNGHAARVEFAPSGAELRLCVDGVWREVGVVRRAAALVIVLRGRNHVLAPHDPLRSASRPGDSDRRLIAPLPARVTRVHATNGQVVKAGASIVTLEVMKTEFVLRAPRDGAIAGLACKEGEWVPEGATLAYISDDAAPVVAATNGEG
ncbi:biotin carboxylase N-terminal domain-containing protein [Methylocystis bryophila]|uniref:3-methylcrotonyl-CoA carboxylase n=2 Tax=Methylocystis bryophila TaxID=655015 RepID=A0A1W6N1M7_9HYPH|nr:biotin carboxylase N-terminal domain-containing protein [Methylocystis bryophila]ARN83725.1 3-methylcrotonyl-CoA carboxylase [Methylocystis bryophila]